MKKFFVISLFIICALFSRAEKLGTLYQRKDSVKIESILREARTIPVKDNIVLFFARKFMGIPYGAATLEASKGEERLIFTLDKLDCTTFVDAVTALTLTYRHGQSSFTDFCSWLQKIRYSDGIINGYPSRLHYYSSWILNGEKHGYVHEIGPKDYPHVSPFTSVQKLNIFFMSHHPDLYPALVKHPAYVSQIRQTERELTGRSVRYIPIKALGGSKLLLASVHDGDILALVTKRGGLDVSHLGFAVWGEDGKLHLLNASSLHHQVILEKNPLQSYMKTQRLQLGVRVIRIK